LRKQASEIKIKITKDELDILIQWLKKNSEYTGQYHQVDLYLEPKSNSFKFKNKLGFIDASKYLKVRLTDQKDYIISRTWYNDKKNSLDGLYYTETKVEVHDGRAALDLFLSLDYKLDTKIDKYKNVYKYNDYRIEIDEVDKLGVFVEIIINKKLKNPLNYKLQICELLKEIGLSNCEMQTRGYAVMSWNKKFDFTQKYYKVAN